MADYEDYDISEIDNVRNTVRYTVKNEVTYQIRVICYFRCKHDGRDGTVDGFSNGYQHLNYEVMLNEAINQAFYNLENCSPEKFYPVKVNIIEYRPQTPYLDEGFRENMSYLQIKQRYGKKAISKTEYDTMQKLLRNKDLTKSQIAVAAKVNKKYGKALKRISGEIGTKKDYENAVRAIEKGRERAKKEKKANKERKKE